MTDGNAVRGKIAPYALFFLVFISRIIVVLTYVRGVSIGAMDTRILLSIALGMVMTLALSLPAYICTRRGIHPAGNRPVGLLYAVYFVCFCGITICRFSYFAAARMSVSMHIVFFILLITAVVAYCSTMGLEALSRFGFFCGIIVIIVVVGVLLMNIGSFHIINMYPTGDSGIANVLRSAVVFCANSNEPVLLLVLAGRTNGNVARPYFCGIAAAYAAIILLVAGVLGAMGAGAAMQSYPVFTLFQLASVGGFSRLDIVHVSFWIMALLVKTVLLVTAAADCVRVASYRKRVASLSILSGGVAVLVLCVVGADAVPVAGWISIGMFAIFALAVPIFCLIMKRRDRV